MRPLPKLRSKTTALVLTSTLCTAPGCVSAPQPQPTDPPKPQVECPPGAQETYKRYGMVPDQHVVKFVPGADPTKPTRLRDGQQVKPEILANWGRLPDRTRLSGRVWFGKERVYGRLTEILLADGTTAPICLFLYFNGVGLPMDPGSTRREAIVPVVVEAFADYGDMKP